jgi:hypothetical protein
MTTTEPLSSSVEEPPSPRRSDDAFAFAVGADVAAIRAARSSWRVWLWAPVSAAAAAGLLLVVQPSTKSAGEMPRGALPGEVDEADMATIAATLDAGDQRPSFVALIDAVDAIDDDATLLALSGSNDSSPSFAFDELEGSSERDLVAIEMALDRALAPL